MAKKIVKVEDKKEGLDLGKITKSIMENGEAIGKIADGIGDIIDGANDSKKKKVKKAKEKKSDSMSKVFDIAEQMLKK